MYKWGKYQACAFEWVQIQASEKSEKTKSSAEIATVTMKLSAIWCTKTSVVVQD